MRPFSPPVSPFIGGSMVLVMAFVCVRVQSILLQVSMEVAVVHWGQWMTVVESLRSTLPYQHGRVESALIRAVVHGLFQSSAVTNCVTTMDVMEGGGLGPVVFFCINRSRFIRNTCSSSFSSFCYYHYHCQTHCLLVRYKYCSDWNNCYSSRHTDAYQVL